MSSHWNGFSMIALEQVLDDSCPEGFCQPSLGSNTAADLVSEHDLASALET